MKKDYYITFCKGIIYTGLMFFLTTVCGCYFDVYKKTNYVSQVTVIIKKNQDEVNNYAALTMNEENFNNKELEKKFTESKEIFAQNKKELDAIVAPKDYEDEHKNIQDAFDECIKASDISLEILKMEGENAEFVITDEILALFPEEIDDKKLEKLKDKSFTRKALAEALKEIGFNDADSEMIVENIVDISRIDKVQEAKAKIDESKRLIKMAINNISIDLR